MYTHNDAVFAIDKGVYIIRSQEELETIPEGRKRRISQKNKNGSIKSKLKNKLWSDSTAPIILHYTLLFILGILTWGMLWFTWGDGWRWNGPWFRLTLIAGVAWASSIMFRSLTTLPPMLAPLMIGILVRNLDYLDMREFVQVDMFLRKIYPVIILGKGSLNWNLSYMKTNWRQIAALGALPWTADVLTMATCMHLLLGHPFLWGLSFGALYASVSGPVVMPVVLNLTSGLSRNWKQLMFTSGGIDVSLSVGVYGMIKSYMDSNVDETYRHIRLFLTPVVGVGVGVAWGYLAGFMPHKKDFYVTELRVLFVLIGGFFANLFCLYFNWNGAAGIAVLVCNAVAAREWVKQGWDPTNNPAVTSYRAMWSACEPVLFAYTGSFFVLNDNTYGVIKYGIVILVLCETLRLIVASLVCWNMTLKEKLFVCCCWSPKTIVQAVLCPMSITSFIESGGSEEEQRYGEEKLIIAVLAIIITTPAAFLVTKYCGPLLLKQNKKENTGL